MTRRRRTATTLGLAGGLALAALAAACVAPIRADIPYAKLEAKYANGASRFMDLPGGLRVHYRDQGNPSGPPVVMIHGFAASLEAWEPWVARLGDRYRIVTLDLPAHGLTRAPSTWRMSLSSSAEVVDQLATRLQLGRFVAIGNSMGGGVAWTEALAHPDHVRALVLVDSVGGPMRQANGGRPSGVFALMRSPVGRAVLRWADTRPMAEKGLRDAYVDPHLVTPALVDRYVDLSRAPGHRAIILASTQQAPVPLTAFQAIAVPTLVLHGEDDRLIPLASGRALAEAIPGARLITYPGAGHVPMEQIPDRTAADVRAFLDALPD